MAYGSKYTINWTTPTADCRLWIKQEGYSGVSTALDPAPTPISIRWGEQGRDDLTSPLRISTARIRFIGDNKGQMVEEVFDGGDTEYLVKFWRDTGSGYELEWEGYLATDLWRDNPHLPAEVIELEAIDGLALLENRQAFTQVGTNDPYEFYRLEQALRHVLRGWDPNLASPADAPMHDLPITTSQNWRPDGLGLTNPSTDQPFDELHIYNTAFQELDDLREPTGTLDQRTQLEGILERFGLTLMLSSGEWRLRQRDQIVDGTSLKTWTMPTGEGFFGSSSTSDVTTSLPAAARTEKPRSRASRLQRLKSAYSYDDLGQFVVNEGFEEPLSTGWTVFGTANRKKYVNSSIFSGGSQYFLNMGNGSFEQPDGQKGSFVKQNVPARFYDAGPGSALEVKWDLLISNSGAGYGNAETRIGLGDYNAQARRIQIKTDVEPGKDATIPLKSPLPGADGTVIIPEGMQVRTGDSSSDVNENSITLTEPGRAGDESLTADVDVGSTIKAGDFVLFFVWSDTTTTGFQGTREYYGLLNDVLDYPSKINSHNTLNPQTLLMPLHTPQGISLVDEDLSIAFWCDDSSDSSIDWNLIVDNISVQLLVGGDAIEETRYIANSGKYGREQTLNHRIGDGPTTKHPRGIFDASGQQIFTDWGYEAGQGETGKLLEQLLVEQWMRQQRDTLDRRTYQCELRGSDSLKPHHVVGFDSKTYTVSFLERQYGTSDDSARVEMTEKVDAGIAGLKRAYSMESESTSSGGGGGSSTVINTGNQTIEGAADWNALAGKPSGLFAQNGDSDGFAETQALGSIDVTDVLDLSGSTFLEVDTNDNLALNVKDEDDFASNSASHLATQQSIKAFVEGQTLSSQEVLDALGLQSSTFLEARNGSLHARVKDEDGFSSDSDTHLATQQSIKAYVQSATGSLAGLNDVDLDFGDTGVQADDLLAYNGSVWTDKDPSEIKVGNADKLDGYEASSFTRKAEDATVTGQWTFKDRITLDSAQIRTSGAATGFSSSGTIIDDQESWFDDVQVRGTLFAREFEVKKLDVSRGEHIFGPGGGKVKEVVSQDGTTATLDFEENPGIKAGDYCLIKETNATDGAIAIEIRLEATSTGSTVDFNVLNSGDNTYRQVEAGDDVVVVASSNSGRDSMVYVNPYGPYIDTVGGLSDFSAWDNRSPGARFGNIAGMPSIGGQNPSGSGLWGDNVYLEGTIVANQGAIADSVTVGSTNAKDLASESFVTTKAGDAESNAISYADGLDSSVRSDLSDAFEDAVKDGDTIIEGGVIATDLVTLDSIAFSPVESDSVIASINSSSEGIEINAGKLDIDAGDLNISAGDVEIGADTTFLTSEYDPTTKAPAADAGTIRSDTRPSTRPSGEPLQWGDMWIDTSDGERPYVYDGSQPYTDSGWDKAYTNIQGGDIATNAISATEISVGSVQDIDSDAAIASDIFSGNYGDLSGTPSIPSGDLADLNEVESTHIKDGAVVARTIAAGTAMADKILANTATISAELEMGSAGQIVTDKAGSSDLAYEINEDGIYVADTEELVFGPNRADGTIDRTQENRKGSLDVTALSAPDDAPESITNFFAIRGDKGAMLRARGLGNNVSVYEAGYTAFGVNLNATDDIKLTPDKYGNSGKVRVEGDLNYTGSLTSVSDRRAKADITSISDPLDKATALSGKTYVKEGTEEAGFIAQDVEGVFDVAVSEMEELKGLSYQSFHALWAESIKELKSENDRLRERIDELESQI
ncbi:hypothetical protein GGP85_002918 [Salinibacter ruber]|uniref:tail fiber domain-containing protein n=1 Tax=Salinibacter ruber TaxID=146919 RepID=UPI002169EB05|nr:tail fiber domain-containing protein [Salinibacter ruber]MCS3827448.1 hypothetical protein [Salinibacter ruber]